ncbi:alpha-L-fucosidase-like isoform X2 [Dysidea avara]|uniref:alpha-L-fucosidase-like isoform X2 n=1 Tax=Dysidea avara TaxID=196820 RepID=UPI00332094FC
MVFKQLLFVVLFVSSLATYTPDWSSLDARPIPSWYEDAKFGIFIHWGVFSVPSYGSEHFWYLWKHDNDSRYVRFMKNNCPPNFQYQDFAPMLKAELWDPVKWATLFKKSGARYITFTSKHHEGWTNWPSKYSWNWNSVDLGPHRDIVGELAEAIRNNTDIHFGLYYSLFEFFHPLYLKDQENNFTTQNYVSEVMIPQLQEIIIGYHPELIWSDGDWTANDTYWNSKQFLTWLYNDSPVKDTVVVNDRWGIGSKCAHGGYYTCRNRTNPSYQAHKWENYYHIQKDCWGYNRNLSAKQYATTKELVSILVQTVSCNGNLLLNVAPTHDGRITPIFEERLLQIGSWLNINGEAIYGSRPWKHQNDTTTPFLWYTVSGDGTNNVYAILVEWPKDGSVILGAYKGTSKPHSVKMLGYDGPISYNVQSEGLYITLPVLPPDTELQWAWSLKISST